MVYKFNNIRVSFSVDDTGRLHWRFSRFLSELYWKTQVSEQIATVSTSFFFVLPIILLKYLINFLLQFCFR